MGERAGILGALQKLASNPMTQSAVFQDGGLSLLVESLQSGSDEEKTSVADALCTMADSSDSQVAIGAAGAIPPLVALLRDGSTVQKEKAAIALVKLAENTANQELIAASGGVSALVSRARDLGVNDDPVAATGIDATARDDSTDLTPCQNPRCNALMTLAAKFLSNICDGVAGPQQIIDAKGVQLAVALLESGNDEQQEGAMEALKMVSRDQWAVFNVVSSGAVPLLTKALCEESDSLKWSAAAALKNVTYYNEEARKPVADAGAIQTLMAMVSEGGEDQTTEAVCTLRNLSYEDANHAEFAQCGAISVLVAATQSGSKDLKDLAVDTLSNLVEDATCSAVMVQEGAVEVLIKLLHDGDGDGYILGVLAMKHAAVSGIQTEQRVAALLVIVEHGRGHEIIRALEALAGMATSPAANDLIIAAGGVPVVTALARNGNAREKKAANLVLRALEGHRANDDAPPAKRVKTEPLN